MRFNFIKTSLLLGTACLALSGVAAAGPVIQATSVATDMGVFGSPTFDLIHLIEQDGLTPGYTNGVTDFDSYVPGAVHDDRFEEWQSSDGIATGVVSFDFGVSVSLDGMALWNSDWNNGGPVDLREFEVFYDSDFDFYNGTLGLLVDDATIQTSDPHESQIFAFTATSLRYLHINVQSNFGGDSTGFAGVVFRSASDAGPVPEPGTLALLGLGLVGMGFSRCKKRT